MQIIQSRRILQKTLDRGQPRIGDLASLRAAVDADQNPVDYLIDNLSVSRGGGGQARDARVLNVSLTHSSAADAKVILDALLTEYEEYVKNKFQDVNKDAAVLINQASSDLETELQSAKNDYAAFRLNAPILWSGEGSTNVHQLRYEGIQNEMSTLSIQIGETETRLKVVKVALQKQIDSGASVFDRLALIDEKNAQRMAIMLQVQQGKAATADFQAKQPERMESARVEYTNVMALTLKQKTLIEQYGLGPNHPEIASLREQIAEARKFIDDRAENLSDTGEASFGPEEVLDSYLTLLENDIVALNERKRQLEGLAVVEEEAAKKLVKVEMDGADLQSRIDRQQGLYDTVVDRLRDINIAKDYGGVINDVIAKPEKGKGVWPKLPICLALGTLFGLFCGGMSTAISELGNRKFRSADEVKNALSLPLLSHLPNLNPARDWKLTKLIKRTKSLVSPINYVHHMPKSVNAEIFRGLRTSLFFKCKDNENVFCITSPNQGDGKSTLTTNLATSIAQTDRKVLLVDCDLRRPSVHKLLGVDNQSGLTDVIVNEQEPWDLVQQTEVANLSVLTSGVLPDNPAELLTSERFRDLLGMLKERYDFILLDCPPFWQCLILRLLPQRRRSNYAGQRSKRYSSRSDGRKRDSGKCRGQGCRTGDFGWRYKGIKGVREFLWPIRSGQRSFWCEQCLLRGELKLEKSGAINMRGTRHYRSSSQSTALKSGSLLPLQHDAVID